MVKNYIKIDTGRCTGCGVCSRTCPEMVFAQRTDKSPPELVAPTDCMGCLACEEDCPQGAIVVHRFPNGMGPSDLPRPGAGIDFDKQYDIGIVGAGPAGLTAAIRARQLGLEAVVLDRLPSKSRPHHPDGGILQGAGLYTLVTTPQGLLVKELDLLLPTEISYGPCAHFLFMGPRGVTSATDRTSKHPTHTIDKARLVEILADRALELGVILAYNTRVTRIENTASGCIIELKDAPPLRCRLIISAEGITGRLSAGAGIPVNAHTVAWNYTLLIAPKGGIDGVDEAGFMLGKIEGADTDLPFVSFWSALENRLELGTGSLQSGKRRVLTKPLHAYVDHLQTSDTRIPGRIHRTIDTTSVAHRDGCRVLARRLPKNAVSDGLIAAGDAIASSGMLMNLGAMKTGEIAAEVAARAIGRGDVSAAALSPFNKLGLGLPWVRNMAWMHGLLIEAPLTLNDAEFNALFSILRHLNMDRLNGGGVGALIAMTAFWLKSIPTLLKRRRLVKFIDGSGGPVD